MSTDWSGHAEHGARRFAQIEAVQAAAERNRERRLVGDEAYTITPEETRERWRRIALESRKRPEYRPERFLTTHDRADLGATPEETVMGAREYRVTILGAVRPGLVTAARARQYLTWPRYEGQDITVERQDETGTWRPVTVTDLPNEEKP